MNRWLKLKHPGRKVGLAYFGQINPSLLALRKDGFEWFLPPALPGKIVPVSGGGHHPTGRGCGSAQAGSVCGECFDSPWFALAGL